MNLLIRNKSAHSTFMSFSVVQKVWGFFFLYILPCQIVATNPPHDGSLRMDTLQDYVTEGLHVVHLKMDFFGDEYRYSLTEQEENLRRDYDEKGNWSMLTEEGRAMWTEDMLKLHALVRQKFFQMRQKKILKWKYHLAMRCKSDTQGNIIHVCLISHRPILKRVGIKKMKQLLHWVGTNKLRCGNTRKERLYHEGSISLFMRGSDEKVSHN